MSYACENSQLTSAMNYLFDESGASASEYAVLVAIIIVAVTSAISLFNLTPVYTSVNTKVSNCVIATNGSC